MRRPGRFALALGSALAAGALAALAHPPFGLLPGLFGYAWLLGLLERAGPDRPLRSAFWRGWLAGGAYFLIGCWWVAEAFFVDAADQGWMAPFAVALVAAGLGLFWGAAGALYAWLKPARPLWRVLAFAGALSACEWLRGHVLTGFPWDLPGETWRAGSAPSQAAALVGAYGLTWLTLAGVAGLAAPFALAAGGRRARLPPALGAAILAGLYAFGLMRLARAAPPDPKAPIVRVVQADVPQKMLEDPSAFQAIFARYLRLTAQPASPAPSIVVWPEGAVPASANDLLPPGAWTSAAIAAALSPAQTLLLGAYRTQGQPPAYYNSLVAVRRAQAGLQIEAIYDKYRLVPFGEYLPLASLLGPLGIKKLVHVSDGFSSGPPPQPIEAFGLPTVQPLICYEALFPGFTRKGQQLAGFRARWIVNVSDDAWFGATSGPLQHLNLASYRAIEEGLPLVRATPTGVSAIVDAYGRAPAALRLGLGRQGVIDAPLPPALPPTPFNRFGDGFFAMMLAASFVVALPRFSPIAAARFRT